MEGTNGDDTKNEYFTLEEGKLMILERNGTTKKCIAGPQIKHWIGEMHIYQQQHFNIDQTWFRVVKGY